MAIFILSKRLNITALTIAMSLFVGCSKDDDDDAPAATPSANFTLNGSAEGVSSLLDTLPSIAKLGLFQFAVSEHEDCTDATIVVDNGDTPEIFDMLDSPQLGQGYIPDGTYPCVIMVMSPQLTVAAGETSGVCKKDEEFSQNVCGRGGDGNTVDLEGNSQKCDSATDKTYLYLSTGSLLTEEYEEQNCHGQGSSCNSFAPPTSASKAAGVPLGAALVVSGDGSGTFTLGNLRTGEEGDNNNPSCGLQRPSFTFSSETES